MFTSSQLIQQWLNECQVTKHTDELFITAYPHPYWQTAPFLTIASIRLSNYKVHETQSAKIALLQWYTALDKIHHNTHNNTINVLLFYHQHAVSVFLDTCTIMHKVFVFFCYCINVTVIHYHYCTFTSTLPSKFNHYCTFIPDTQVQTVCSS